MKKILFGVCVLAMAGCGSENLIGKGRNKVGLAEFGGETLSCDRKLQSADCPPEDANKRAHGNMQERIDQARCYGK